MANNYDDSREVTYEIVEEIGIIASSSTGWTKELNIVAWNGGQGKYDIREWSPHHDRMSKGITLNEQEMRTVMELLKRRSRYVPRGVNAVQPAGGNGVPDPSDDKGWNAVEEEKELLRAADDEPTEELRDIAS